MWMRLCSWLASFRREDWVAHARAAVDKAGCRGTVKLIDYGAMTLLSEIEVHDKAVGVVGGIGRIRGLKKTKAGACESTRERWKAGLGEGLGAGGRESARQARHWGTGGEAGEKPFSSNHARVGGERMRRPLQRRRFRARRHGGERQERRSRRRRQAAADAVLCPSYASPELRAVLQRRGELGRLVLGNDVWMAAHVLLVLCCQSDMPR